MLNHGQAQERRSGVRKAQHVGKPQGKGQSPQNTPTLAGVLAIHS